jgi:hypothetical protein
MQNPFLTIGICLVLAAVVFAIVFSLIRDKRKGRSPSCGAGCENCAMHGCCHKAKEAGQ